MTSEDAALIRIVLSVIHPDAEVEVTADSDGAEGVLTRNGVAHRFKIDSADSPVIRALVVGVPLE